MSLAATRIQNFRVNNPRFDGNMVRPCEYGALDFFVQQVEQARSFVTPELAERAMNSIGTGLQIPVINYDGDISISNVRSCTIADSENTSTLFDVVFATFATGFTMVPARHLNNDISYQRDFDRKFEKHVRALACALDIAAVAALSANKTQVFNDLLSYTEVGNAIRVEWENRMEILGDIDPIMRANCYSGLIHIIGNAGVDSMVRKMAQLGENNAINKVLEYAGKVLHYTNNVANESGIYGGAFAVEDGQVGYVTRSARENLLGTRANFHEFDIVNLPIVNIPVDTHYYTTIGDQTKIGGVSSEDIADMNCNVKQHFGFAVDIAFLVSYNSNPEEVPNPIVKIEVDSPSGIRSAIPVTVTNVADFPTA
jgi:hypothetical protein